MRNRICGGIGVVWGGAIVGYAIFNGISQAGGGYAAGQLAGVVLRCADVHRGLLLFGQRAKAKYRPIGPGESRDFSQKKRLHSRRCTRSEDRDSMGPGHGRADADGRGSVSACFDNTGHGGDRARFGAKCRAGKKRADGACVWIIGVLLIFGGCTTYLIGVLTALAAPARDWPVGWSAIWSAWFYALQLM